MCCNLQKAARERWVGSTYPIIANPLACLHQNPRTALVFPVPRTGFPCSPPENSLFDQTNSLFRGVGNSKLKPHDISGLGGFDPAYSRPNPRNSLYFPCKTGKSGQRRVRSRLPPPPPFSFHVPRSTFHERSWNVKRETLRKPGRFSEPIPSRALGRGERVQLRSCRKKP